MKKFLTFASESGALCLHIAMPSFEGEDEKANWVQLQKQRSDLIEYKTIGESILKIDEFGKPFFEKAIAA